MSITCLDFQKGKKEQPVMHAFVFFNYFKVETEKDIKSFMYLPFFFFFSFFFSVKRFLHAKGFKFICYLGVLVA